MRVVHIHRATRFGGHSIETLFRTIAVELRKNGVTVIEYEMGSVRRILVDLMLIRRFKADIYHVTGDVNYLALLLPWNKTVLTVHDIGHYLYGLKGLRKVIYKWLWIIVPIYTTRKTTVVSKVTKAKLQEHFSIPSDRISVIENCHGQHFFQRLKPLNISNPRILQVGTASNKNVPRLIEALSDVPCTLILIGKITAEIDLALKSYGIKYENYTDVDEAILIKQYDTADIVAFVSTHEGFGMPIIEAQALGRALITSNMLPMSDVAGPGACLVNPLDVTSIRAAFKLLLSDNECREKIIEAGLNNVERFSPETVATKYLEVYKSVLQHEL